MDYQNVLKQLLEKVPKDKRRRVCGGCKELGHISTSTICKLNQSINQKLKNKIKQYILSKDCLQYSTDELLQPLSKILQITPNMCRTLYAEIPPIELINRPADIELYLKNLVREKCTQCKTFVSEQPRYWKNQILCDLCWISYSAQRQLLWQQIKSHTLTKCVICGRIQSHPEERFHYDHRNMFEKSDSICAMVGYGCELDIILAEIAKCQILCLVCHHYKTMLENRMGFVRLKQNLNRRFNQQEISSQSYQLEIEMYAEIYRSRINSIVHSMSKYITV
jgi:hypothetical protein